jgi:hypothetical protein
VIQDCTTSPSLGDVKIGNCDHNSKGKGGVSITQMGLFRCSMGLEWRRIHTRASKATTSSKSFILEGIGNVHIFY